MFSTFSYCAIPPCFLRHPSCVNNAPRAKLSNPVQFAHPATSALACPGQPAQMRPKGHPLSCMYLSQEYAMFLPCADCVSGQHYSGDHEPLLTLFVKIALSHC